MLAMNLTRLQRAGMNGAKASLAIVLRRGVTHSGQPLWSDDEIRALRAAWPDRAAALRALPFRTLRAIEGKAAKIGLPRKALHVWSGAEAVRYRRMWPVATKRELLEAFPFATWGSLQN
jgi:hypothetical protein